MFTTTNKDIKLTICEGFDFLELINTDIMTDETTNQGQRRLLLVLLRRRRRGFRRWFRTRRGGVPRFFLITLKPPSLRSNYSQA